jgi:L-arabinokinase
VRYGHTPHLHGGFTLIIESGWRGDVDHQPLGAALAATMQALAVPLGMDGDLEHIVRICGQAHRSINGIVAGMASASAPLAAQTGCVLPIACRPFSLGEPIRLPDQAMIVGIHCGVRHPEAARKYAHARTTALMGREIIRRLRDARAREQWDGMLASISVTEYVEHLRDRLPTKLTGQHFLDCCGPLADEDATIDPQGTYKIRSRAEHHIYEDGRVRQFAERVSRAARTGQEQSLADAGELMYASHWSYGQRCGLGSIESDLLVNLLRQAGPSAGIFGARVSGRGAGGTVVALARRTPEAVEAIRTAVEVYQRKTRHAAHMLPMALPQDSSDPFATAHS